MISNWGDSHGSMDLSLLRQKECSGGKGQEMRASMTASRHPLAQAVWSSVCRRDGDIAVTEIAREREREGLTSG